MQGPDFSCVSYVDTTLIKKKKQGIFSKKKKTEDRKKWHEHLNQ